MSWSEEEYKRAYGIPQTLPSQRAADPFPEPKIVAGIVDGGTRKVHETGAMREGKKNAPHMLPTYALRRWADHLHAGAVKYEKFNMRKGLPFSTFLDAIHRHWEKLIEGNRDEDHLAAILWNAGEMCWTEEMIKQGRLPASLDDRFVAPSVIDP